LSKLAQILTGFTKIKKKHLLKISAVYLIGKAEICQDPPSWIQDDQTLFGLITLLFSKKHAKVQGHYTGGPRLVQFLGPGKNRTI
jgi:hypothetical protein